MILTFGITMDSSDSDRWMSGFLLRPLFGGCCLLRPLLDALLAATFSLQGLRWLPTLWPATTYSLLFRHVFLLIFLSSSTRSKPGRSAYWSNFLFCLLFSNWQHNSPIYDECQTQSAKVLALPWKRAHEADSNNTPQPKMTVKLTSLYCGLRLILFDPDP